MKQEQIIQPKMSQQQEHQSDIPMNTKMPSNMSSVLPPHFDFMRNPQSKYCFTFVVYM